LNEKYTSLQEHMTKFRLKLAAILLDSPLNTAAICEYEKSSSEEEEVDPNDCVMIEKPEQALHESILLEPNKQLNTMSSDDIYYSICEYILSTNDEENLRYVTNSTVHRKRLNISIYLLLC